MVDLIKPKDVTVDDIDGQPHTYTISRVPATVGRRILAEYGTSALPKIGEYEINEQCMLLMMQYVETHLSDGRTLRLTTKALVDNHIPDFECLLKIEKEMIDYNCTFFRNGRASTFFESLAQQAMQWVIKTLTPYLAPYSSRDVPHSKN